MFELKGVDLSLINKEIPKYVTYKFIQYKVEDFNFHSFNIQKYFILCLWSRLNGIQKYIHVPAPEISYDLHQNAFCTFWVPVQSLRAVRFQDFIKKLFIPILIWQTIRIRSNVQLQQVLFFWGFFMFFFLDWVKGFGVRICFYSTSQAR